MMKSHSIVIEALCLILLTFGEVRVVSPISSTLNPYPAAVDSVNEDASWRSVEVTSAAIDTNLTSNVIYDRQTNQLQTSNHHVFLPLVGWSAPIARFRAHWRNENPNTGGITRAAIRSQSDVVYVHMWGKCTPTDCDWGETTTTTSDALDGTLSITWTLSFKVETQQISILGNGSLRVAGHVVYNDGRPTRDYVEFFTPPSPEDITYAAIRLEDFQLSQSVYSVGDLIEASARFVNRSPRALDLVISAPLPYCTIGGQQQWIERLGPDPTIPPFDDGGIAFDGRRYAAGGAALAVTSCTLAPDEPRAAYNLWNQTTGFPVGNYLFYMEYRTFDGLVMQSEVAPFEMTPTGQLRPC